MDDVIHALMFIAIFGSIFLAVIGIEMWVLSRQNLQSYYWKETLSNMTTGAMYKVVDGIAIALFIQVFYDYVREYGFQYSPDVTAFSLIFLFLAVDFFFYAYHFLMHKVRWMWSVHATHHTSKNLNFSTALRQNFLLDLNFGWVFWWLPLALIGFEKDWVILAIEANLAYQFFLHTETVKRLGPLEWVLNTPSHHRVHHGCNEKQVDTNFGGVFIVWDRLFGTFRDETEAGELKYGVAFRQTTTLNPLRLNLDEFIDMFKDVYRYKDLSIFVRHPSYVEERYRADEKKAAQ